MTREQWDEVFAKVDNMPAEELEKIIAEAARKAGVLQTNADRIRAMSDEELAEWATTVGRTFGEEYEGYMSALDWLKAPADKEGER